MGSLPLTVAELSRLVRQFKDWELRRLMRELWKYDPLAYGNLRRAIDEVGREEVARAKENWQEP